MNIFFDHDGSNMNNSTNGSKVLISNIKTVVPVSFLFALAVFLQSCVHSSDSVTPPSNKSSVTNVEITNDDQSEDGRLPEKTSNATGVQDSTSSALTDSSKVSVASDPALEYLEKMKALSQIGSGDFINKKLAADRGNRAEVLKGDVNLQFNNTKIAEVVRTILGELLNKTYVISPKVGGTVTFSTAKPIARKQLKHILETLLSWNGAAVVLREGIYHVVQLAEAIPGRLTPNIGPLPDEPGYEVQIVPLKYISPSEMQKLLKPFLANQAAIQADDDRGFLILAGTLDQLDNYIRTINIFDVNWLSGMSVGVFPLEVTDPKTIINELKVFLGSEGPLKNTIRFMPMERLNAVVAMTSQPEYLRKIQELTEKLDQKIDAEIDGNSVVEQRLYVYYVKNVDAEKLSATLQSIFSQSSQRSQSDNGVTQKTRALAPVVPGLAQVELSRDGKTALPTSNQSNKSQDNSIDISLLDSSNISITAVGENNALLIKSSASQYRDILKAIKKLDVMPLQVLIEATILEVTLSDGFSYGVEWYLKNAASDFLQDGTAAGGGFLRLGSGGLSYRVGSNDLAGAISALKTDDNTKILSSPSLWALNNEQASINIGTQIPVNTTSINTGGDSDVITSEVQFRDTGVILDVTPRIHPGGLVFLDVSQSISTPTGTADSNGNVPISQRVVKTKIAVNSGQTVLLAGLISETDIEGQSGVPVMSRIPFLGGLFGRSSKDVSRNEIVVIIKPTVIYDQDKNYQIMDEYQKRFQYITPLAPESASVNAKDRYFIEEKTKIKR